MNAELKEAITRQVRRARDKNQSIRDIVSNIEYMIDLGYVSEFKELAEIYERRVGILKDLIATTDSDSEQKRLKVKLGCYRAFLHDLKQINQQCKS